MKVIKIILQVLLCLIGLSICFPLIVSFGMAVPVALTLCVLSVTCYELVRNKTTSKGFMFILLISLIGCMDYQESNQVFSPGMEQLSYRDHHRTHNHLHRAIINADTVFFDLYATSLPKDTSMYHDYIHIGYGRIYQVYGINQSSQLQYHFFLCKEFHSDFIVKQ